MPYLKISIFAPYLPPRKARGNYLFSPAPVCICKSIRPTVRTLGSLIYSSDVFRLRIIKIEDQEDTSLSLSFVGLVKAFGFFLGSV